MKRFDKSLFFFSFFKVKISPHLLDYENANSEAKKDDKNDPNEGGPSSGQANQAQLGVSDLFKNPFVRKVTLIMFFNWIVVTLGNIFVEITKETFRPFGIKRV